MAAESTIVLREIAHRLGNIRRLPSGKSAVPELLRLLKSGELNAGFAFPARSVHWISIPTSYWTGVTSQEFRSLQFVQGDKHKTGTYTVRISQFADEYVRVVSQQFENDGASGATRAKITLILDELKTALSVSQRSYEVALIEQEWTDYLQRHSISESSLQQKPSAGRREKTSWHHLVPIIAGYMMTLDKRPQESRDHFFIGTKILELAEKAGIPDLPSADTIRDVISKVFASAGEFSKQ
jgi:hypothetical protein